MAPAGQGRRIDQIPTLGQTHRGAGSPRREVLHVHDCAAACVHLMKTYSDFEHVDVSSGEDDAILELMRGDDLGAGLGSACKWRPLHSALAAVGPA